MNELSLFTGAGGGLLGTHLLGWRPIGYVEYDDYCQQVIAARIADGYLPAAPIFGDVRQFVESGAARQYRGFADVVTAGFPCQPFSIAGKQQGADDERNMWPATIECIRLVRPRYCLLENVPGLISNGYLATVLGDLAACGYDARWRVLSAAEVGAPHKRDRIWIVAHAKQSGRNRGTGEQRQARRAEPENGGQNVPNADRSEQGRRDKPQRQPEQRDADPSRNGTEGATNGQWWATEPGLGRVAHGIPDRVDRLKALGNGQVPLVAATAWRLLTEDWD